MNFVIRSCLGNRDPRSPEARQRCGTLAGGVGILLNLLLHGIFYYHGAFAFVFYYVWLEVLVLVIEGLIYRVLLVRGWDRPRKPHPWLYATVANAASLGLGLLIANWIPGIF